MVGIADEAELIRALAAHEPKACEAFVRGESGRALAVARKLCRDDAEAQDVVQEAFASFFRSIGKFEAGAKLSTWLYRIVVNAGLMRRRTRARKPEVSIEELLPKFLEDGHRADVIGGWSKSASELAADAEVRRLVREKIDELPEDYRDVIVLRDIEEFDTEETARMLDLKEGAVKTRLHRARQALRRLLEEELAD